MPNPHNALHQILLLPLKYSIHPNIMVHTVQKAYAVANALYTIKQLLLQHSHEQKTITH